MTRWDMFWETEADDFSSYAHPTVAIVGAPDVGKKTLLNTLWGWDAIADSAESVRNFGLFTLIDVSADGIDANDRLYQLEGAALIVYVIDGTRDLSQSDFAWVARIRALNVPLVVAASKLDLLPKSAQPNVLKTFEDRLSQSVEPLHAHDSKQVFAQFVPRLTEAAPQIAVRLAAEVKTLRQSVAYQIVTRAAMDCLTLNGSNEDSPVSADTLCALQTQMIGRLAGLFGHRDLSRTSKAALTQTLQDLTCRALKILDRVPGVPTRMLMRGAAAVSTLAVGTIAAAYYGGMLKRLPLLPSRSKAHGHG